MFHLRDDVHWSDGLPVTAGDFVYAWLRVLDPTSGSPNAKLLYDIKGARAYHMGETNDPAYVAAHARDDYTLVVELEGPTGYFLSLMAHYATFPIPRHVVKAHGDSWAEFGNIVTNGAFKLEAWQPDKKMTLVRAPDYHGQFTGNLERVEIAFDVKWSTQMQMYEDDELDYISFGGTPAQKDRARRRHADEHVSAPMLGATYVSFDVSRSPFDDIRVRRAFAHATDKAALAGEILRGYEFPATGGFVPPGVPGHAADISPPYDPELARQLLSEAGYPGGHTFPKVDAWTWQGIKNRADFLQDQWRDNLGVEINWNVMEFPVFIEKVDQAQMHIIQTAWMPDYPDPDSILRASPVRGRANWRDEAFETLVEKARRVLDQGERLKIYAKADRIMVQEQVVVMPLTYMWSHILVKPWVRKFPTSAINEWLWKDFIIEAHGKHNRAEIIGGKDD
jgi:oligopeptide transport system substrate-binding protein